MPLIIKKMFEIALGVPCRMWNAIMYFGIVVHKNEA